MTIATPLSAPSGWGTTAMTHLVPLAEDLDENKVTPGVLGFIVFALIGGAVWLLMKNMNKQFGKIDFDESTDGGEGGGTDGHRPAEDEADADAEAAAGAPAPRRD